MAKSPLVRELAPWMTQDAARRALVVSPYALLKLVVAGKVRTKIGEDLRGCTATLYRTADVKKHYRRSSGMRPAVVPEWQIRKERSMPRSK